VKQPTAVHLTARLHNYVYLLSPLDSRLLCKRQTSGNLESDEA
jgi:hypothetical protein